MPKRFRDWLSQAENDLEHARKSLKMEDYSWSCFASQQAAEKAVKALYDFLGGDGWGHSIVKLLRELPPDKATVKKKLLEAAVHLDKLYIPTRYPNGFDAGAPQEYYTAKESEEAIKHARVILSFVKAQIH